MISVTEVRKGRVLKIDGELYVALSYEHHKPGKGGAIVRIKMKNLLKETVMEKTYKGGDMVEDVMVEDAEAQLLYTEGDHYVFMDNETFEQYEVPESVVGDNNKYLKNEMICNIAIYEEQVIAVYPPMFVELEVTETDPGLKGDTVSGGTKPATLETGAVVQVPLFVNLGEKIKVDTRDDRYIERVK